ncbi:MAG: hypothetical protein ACOCYO_01965 [Bacteroidota bacterium]
MGKIYVHIGLPKTATTSLQKDFFEKLPSKRFIYLGVLQSRKERIQHTEFKKFSYFLNSHKGADDIKDIFTSIINKGKDIVISEEMIVVGDWRQKIKNLKEILKGFDYHILITIRNPLDGVLSYYYELNHVFTQKYTSFSDAALIDDSMKIFHYNIFFDYMFDVFESERVHVYAMEKIVKEDLSSLLELFDIKNSKFNIRNRNISKKNDDKIVKFRKERKPDTLNVKKYKESKVYLFFKNSFLRNMIRNFILFINRPRVVIKKDFINKPDNTELKIVKDELVEGIIYVNNKFSINYF